LVSKENKKKNKGPIPPPPNSPREAPRQNERGILVKNKRGGGCEGIQCPLPREKKGEGGKSSESKGKFGGGVCVGWGPNFQHTNQKHKKMKRQGRSPVEGKCPPLTPPPFPKLCFFPEVLLGQHSNHPGRERGGGYTSGTSRWGRQKFGWVEKGKSGKKGILVKKTKCPERPHTHAQKGGGATRAGHHCRPGGGPLILRQGSQQVPNAKKKKMGTPQTMGPECERGELKNPRRGENQTNQLFCATGKHRGPQGTELKEKKKSQKRAPAGNTLHQVRRAAHHIGSKKLEEIKNGDNKMVKKKKNRRASQFLVTAKTQMTNINSPGGSFSRRAWRGGGKGEKGPWANLEETIGGPGPWNTQKREKKKKKKIPKNNH